MRKKAVFALLLLVLFGLGCRKEDAPLTVGTRPADSASSPAEGVVRLSGEAFEIVGIKTEEVRPGECKSVLKRMGKVLAPQTQTAIVSHAFPARVAEIHVNIGDWVKQGQALITLDSQEVGRAKSEFYKAIAAAELAFRSQAFDALVAEVDQFLDQPGAVPAPGKDVRQCRDG